MAQWGLLYQGQWYSWQKKGRGTDARAYPGASFVCFLENHDQVANTGFGLRLHQTTDGGFWRTMTALLMLGPGVPMLFQGQERVVGAPFTYFADHEPPLSDMVRSGREEFLSQFVDLRDPESRRRLPEPSDEAAFRRCRIEWEETDEAAHAWQLHVDLLALRRSDPVISRAGTRDVTIATSAPTSSVVIIRYRADDQERLLLANLGTLTTLRMNDPLLAPPQGQSWVSLWCSESSEYGGLGSAPGFLEGAWRLQGHCAWLLQNRT